MTITIDAIYENGVLIPKQPLELSDGAQVQIIVQTPPDVAPDVASALAAVQRSYGLLRWSSDVETLNHIALDDEFSIWEAR